MPLRLELFPKQRALIGTTCVQNVGSQTISLMIETFSKLVRGKYLITADQVDTACKELHFSIIRMYLAEHPGEHRSMFIAAGETVSSILPGANEALRTLRRLVDSGDYYPALKQSFTLLSLEAQISNGERPRFNKPAPGAVPTRNVELGPSERLVLGAVMVRNCEIRARLAIDADANFIQGKHLIRESEADTPGKRLYILVQRMCMAGDAAPLMAEFNATAHEVIARMPAAVPKIVAIHERVNDRRFLQALAAGRELISAETNVGRQRAPPSISVAPERKA